MLVLDTSVLIDIERKDKRTISKLLELKLLHPERLAISFATFSEFLYGALRRKKNMRAVVEFLANYTVLQSTLVSARLFGEIKYRLELQGKNIQDFDVLIASTVLAHGGVLITKDDDFKRIQGLQLILV